MSSIGTLPEGAVNPEDGSLNVTAVIADDLPGGPPEAVLSVFAQALAVPDNVQTLIQSYTVPALKICYLQRIDVGGGNIGTYEVFVNAVLFARVRTWFNGVGLSTSFVFDTWTKRGYPLAAGTVVEVKVFHKRPYVADYESRIHGIEVG